MRSRVVRTAILMTTLLSVASTSPVLGAAINPPLITTAVVSTDGTLTISGSDFIVTPRPRVWWGTDAGTFESLPVIGVSTTTIEAQLGPRPSGSYRLIVQFGPVGLLISTLSVTIGAAGPQGATGPEGPTGPAGPTGSDGVMGPVGPPGPVGPAGADGAAGQTGPAGADGPMGPQGSAGADGPTGAAGPAGATGSTGPIGPTGSMGPAGPTGPSGLVGLAGKSCPTGGAVTGFDVSGELICAPIPVSSPPEAILVWHFDDGTASDSSGHELNGTLVAPSPTAGYSGQGLDFNDGGAGSQYILLADSDALTPPIVTLDLWIKPESLNTDNQMIVHKYQNNAPSNSDYLLFFVNDSLRFATRGSEVLSTTLIAGRWYHITAIANGADSRLYVDGVLRAAGMLSLIPNGSQSLVIGSCISSCAPNNRTFDGIIDEVTIWKGVKLP